MLNADIMVDSTSDTTADDGHTTLREALTLAGSQAGDDTIKFDATVFTSASLHTITPAPEPFTIVGGNGKLTIVGPGAGVLAISSVNSGRAFDVSATANATISGMTLRDGTAQGGAIQNLGTLALSGMLITENAQAPTTPPANPGGDGTRGGDAVAGAINNAGKLTIDASTVSDNIVYAGNGGAGINNAGAGGNAFGGAIFSTGDVTITNATFSGNFASGGNGAPAISTGGAGGAAQGGAIYMNSGTTLSITNSRFTENGAVGGGSGGGSITANGSGGAGIGGAIYAGGTLAINGSTVSGNNAAGGSGASGGGLLQGGTGGGAQAGGIYAAGAISGSNVTFQANQLFGGNSGASGATVQGTHAAGEAVGGALFVASTASGSLSNTFFVGNNATGGIGTFGGATGGGGGKASGGGANIDTPNFAFNTALFSANKATGGKGGLGTQSGPGGQASGGAVAFNGSGTLTITNADINLNSAQGGSDAAAAVGNRAGDALGGAIASTGKVTVANAAFTSNSAKAGDGIADDQSHGGDASGGAIYSTSSLTVADSTFTTNSVTGGFSTGANGGNALGGAISNESFLPADITAAGAPVAAVTSSVSITRSALTQNTATGGKLFMNNTPFGGGSGTGGAMHINADQLTITASTIDHNQAIGGEVTASTTSAGGQGGSARGGAVDFNVSLNALITNSTLANNSATGGKGGDTSGGGLKGGDGGVARGGAIYDNAAVPNAFTAVNVTIAYNNVKGGALGASGTGGAAALAGHGFGGGVNSEIAGRFYNVIASDNTSDFQGPDLFGNYLLVHSLVPTPGETGYNMTTGSTGNQTGPANLGLLADNGGPTKTILPGNNSTAIDHGDNAAATTQFGANGFDQRGAGFARFLGDVEIGATEVASTAAPKIGVSGNDDEIANNDTTPQATDFTDFGTQFHYAQARPTRTYLILNRGGKTLQISNVQVPAGYTLVSPPAATVAPNGVGSFTVALSTASAGTFAGNIVITSSDPATPQFKFKITGTISTTFKVNFQPLASSVPDGYVADVGQVFHDQGNGLSYGWNLNAQTFTRDRNLITDQARDTFIHTQLYGNRTWEIAVPNGTYQVHIVAGDASFFDSTYKINAENVTVVNGKPTNANRFVEGTQTINVTDGKLTLTNAAGAVNNKFDFVEITPVVKPAIRINFQPGASPAASGFLVDSGAVFGNRGNGQSYGWNQSAGSFARDRNAANSADQQHDTFIHTQLYGSRTWELALPNGTYTVHLVAGDPGFFDSLYKFNAEGSLILSGTPTAGNRWVEGTAQVVVADGRLTITNASGAVNNKIDFIEVTGA